MKRITIVLGILIVAITVFEVRATRVAGGQTVRPSRSVASPRFVSAEGRVVAYPGAEVTIGTDAGGTIARINVEEKDVVRKGQVIATIKADDTRAALVEARSRVGEADADVRLFES